MPTYGKVRYSGVYPGIDLVYYGNSGRLEYDFVVAPGASTKPIHLRFEGAKTLRLDRDGNLAVGSRGGQIGFEKPTIYQVREGKREAVRGSFKLERNREIGFTVDAYDHSRPLVIDPILSYATYLGGSGSPGDYGAAVVVDGTGSAYVAGYTYSSDFPLAGTPLQTTNKGLAQQTPNVFVTKFSADGASLVYSTYLGEATTARWSRQ